MKRLICLVLAALMIAAFASCGGEKPKTENGATEDEANYPIPENNTFVGSKTETGMRYDMTLDRYTSEFNAMYQKLGGNPKEFPYKKWKKIKTEQQDNGFVYDYYALTGGEIVLTAAVDGDSLQIINLGCGITAKKFNQSENVRQKVMTVCGTMAAVAGGYKEDDVVFFGNLFVDTIDSPEHCFWYENSIYLYSSENTDSGETTMLFRTIPAAQNILNDWNLQDYKSYWNLG